MSYDFFVYGSEAIGHDDVATRITNIRGLSFDPAESGPSEDHTWGFLVRRGIRRSYSFTVEGPFPDSGEDMDDRQASPAVLGIRYRYDISVEGGGSAAEIPHAWAFAKKLAKAASGVALDAQTDGTWPEPKSPPLTSYEEYYKDLSIGGESLETQWYFLQSEVPGKLAQTYLDVCRELFPSALPTNYRSYLGGRPWEHQENDNSFLEALQINKMPWLRATGSGIVTNLGFSGLGAGTDVPSKIGSISLTMRTHRLLDPDSLASFRRFFLALAERSNSFFASAEVTRSRLTPESVKQTEEASSQVDRGKWRGLPAHPVWWSYFGTPYVELVRPHLSGRHQQIDGSLFHSYGETPQNRDEIAEILPGRRTHWLPEDLTAVYDFCLPQQPIASTIPSQLTVAK
ncbi:hypothetical protein [Paenarthrobacter aurescens]|uniref:Uncharacterized protein n=1 Tax=Paenarthrobacter aurescens TaxID=43663 RepID=A0A4Y3NFL8_PAEAU|nr:hypothetical protein [Paenarthrobacter aurescens]MDO6142423.1 hypothetical protein [Paenarthrobacter aurescens]MDO6146270.1 hypothetical protein [Paenarthrobacter aurescens]MDO6157515.1 hypothetical protein [Paenarthrobacter aurescens]MDO6161500.1 hypothetical protein [Paenarthrobacter aurescens]GEB20610.1 hypothetical protein AAU01_33650 [Paenarthrobacter aurescens]